MSDRSGRVPPGPNDLVLRCYLRFPGDPEPDLSVFAEPLRIPCTVVWKRRGAPAPVVADAGRERAEARGAGVAEVGGGVGDARALRLMTVAGTTLAVGGAAELAAVAMEVFARMPKGHPVLLASAAGVLAFASATALVEHLVAMSGGRNAGLPPPLRAHSERARASAGAVDRDVTDNLRPDEWSAHHLVSVSPAQRYLDILVAAAGAGWHMDAPENVMALPRTDAARAKLARMGIVRPVHDNGHPHWNRSVIIGLLEIRQKLREAGIPQGTEEYAVLARTLLEKFQFEQRQKALTLPRIVMRDPSTDFG